MKEIAMIKAQTYDARMKLVQALNECGYGTRIVEKKNGKNMLTPDYYIVIYGSANETD